MCPIGDIIEVMRATRITRIADRGAVHTVKTIINGTVIEMAFGRAVFMARRGMRGRAAGRRRTICIGWIEAGGITLQGAGNAEILRRLAVGEHNYEALAAGDVLRGGAPGRSVKIVWVSAGGRIGIVGAGKGRRNLGVISGSLVERFREGGPGGSAGAFNGIDNGKTGGGTGGIVGHRRRSDIR